MSSGATSSGVDGDGDRIPSWPIARSSRLMQSVADMKLRERYVGRTQSFRGSTSSQARAKLLRMRRQISVGVGSNDCEGCNVLEAIVAIAATETRANSGKARPELIRSKSLGDEVVSSASRILTEIGQNKESQRLLYN